MKIVAISDTHMQINKVNLPKGDILVHAGDHSYRGTIFEMSNALKELAEKGKDFKNIVVTGGNHDWICELNPQLMKQLCEDNGIIYLHDTWEVIDGKVFHGSGWTPEFCGWAMNLSRGPALANRWAQIPDKTDVLITHGPPQGILDTCPDGYKAGCEELFKRVMVVRPQIHIFGHIHHSYGIQHFDGITFVNASTCDERYEPINKPIEIEL